jgi:hypothetical protein
VVTAGLFTILQRRGYANAAVDIARVSVRVSALTDVVAAKDRARIDKPTSAMRFMSGNLLVV